MTHAHFLVAKTARELAGTVYEELMAQDAVYARWKAQNPGVPPDKLAERWVARAWPSMIGAARATLAQMLNGPLADVLKSQISDALIKDNALQAARRLQWQRQNRETIQLVASRQKAHRQQ